MSLMKMLLCSESKPFNYAVIITSNFQFFFEFSSNSEVVKLTCKPFPEGISLSNGQMAVQIHHSPLEFSSRHLQKHSPVFLGIAAYHQRMNILYSPEFRYLCQVYTVFLNENKEDDRIEY